MGSLIPSFCADAGIQLNTLAILTAHQMGSTRMGVSRQASAVDPNGESWDVQNLFVADAALMPTSTGASASSLRSDVSADEALLVIRCLRMVSA